MSLDWTGLFGLLPMCHGSAESGIHYNNYNSSNIVFFILFSFLAVVCSSKLADLVLLYHAYASLRTILHNPTCNDE